MNYQKQAQDLADKLGIKLKVLGEPQYKKHFTNDKEHRWVFKMQLSRGRQGYTFNFGQSIAEGATEPTMYDVLACLQKYDVGSFEEFCSEFGYDAWEKDSKRTYNAVCKEWEAMDRMFTSEELELIQEIQ